MKIMTSTHRYTRLPREEIQSPVRSDAILSDGNDESLIPSLPIDRYNIVYLILYGLGIGSLLPWNFFITAKPYFQYKMRNISSDDPADQTHLQSLFENYLILSSNVPNVAFQFVNIFLIKSVSQKVRMTFSCTSMLLVFIVTDVLSLINTDHWQTTFFAITMISVVISNAGQSMFCGVMFGLAAMFPEKYRQGAMTGQALGGTISALANIFTLIGATDVRISAVAFFVCATVMIMLCFIGYLALFFLKYSQYHLKPKRCSSLNSKEFASSKEEPISYEGCSVMTFRQVLKQMWPFAFSSFAVFTVTLAVYPAVTASIVSVNRDSKTDITNKFFSPIVCFLLFNLSDFVGRTVSSYFTCIQPYHRVTITALSILRVAFIPLLLYCNIDKSSLPVVFNGDAYPVVFIVLLGLTNGYLSTLAIMYGPQSIPSHWAEMTGAILSLCISLGLAAGSCMSLILAKFSQSV